jgi:hypothetical protein
MMFSRTFVPLFFIAVLLVSPCTWMEAQTKTKPQPSQRSRQQRGVKQTTADKWVKWTGPDGDFTILLPIKPTPENPANNPQGPVTAIRAYDAATDTILFHINFQDYGGDPNSPEANSFGSSKYEETLVRGLREDGVLVISARRLAPNISEIEYWAPARRNPGHRLHGIQRDIIYRARTYHLSCGSRIEDSEVDRQICRRFFNSFRLTPDANRVE